MRHIHEKLDKIVESNIEQKIALAKLEEMMVHYTEKVQENKEKMDKIEKDVDILEKEFSSHLNFVRGSIWILGAIFTVAATLFKFGILNI